MIKVGLIGDSIDKNLTRQYPLFLNKFVSIDEKGRPGPEIQGDQLKAWLIAEITSANEGDAESNAATMSIILQSMGSYQDVSFSVAQVPMFPLFSPESTMVALTMALQWMAEVVKPDFVHIGFSSPEGKYQKQQNEWVEKLHQQGCKIICPTGIPPAFPALLNHVVSVADRGFIEAGFAFSNPSVVVEENELSVYRQGEWVKQNVSNETASAWVLGNLIKKEIALSVPNPGNPVQLPNLHELSFPAFDQEGENAEVYTPQKPGLLVRIKWYFKSLLSRLITPTGKVPSSIKTIRKVSCNGDGITIAACEFRIQSKKLAGAYVCGACGCGDSQGVFVDGDVPKFEKLDYPYISCPASMPGFSNYLAPDVEWNPSKRKIAIEAKFSKEVIERGQQTQEELSKRLDKRLGWLDQF